MVVKYLTDGDPDGFILGQNSASKIGFFGAAPASRATVTAYTTTTAAVSTSTNWGYTTSTQADAINTAVVQLVAMARNMGLGG